MKAAIAFLLLTCFHSFATAQEAYWPTTPVRITFGKLAYGQNASLRNAKLVSQQIKEAFKAKTYFDVREIENLAQTIEESNSGQNTNSFLDLDAAKKMEAREVGYLIEQNIVSASSVQSGGMFNYTVEFTLKVVGNYGVIISDVTTFKGSGSGNSSINALQNAIAGLKLSDYINKIPFEMNFAFEIDDQRTLFLYGGNNTDIQPKDIFEVWGVHKSVAPGGSREKKFAGNIEIIEQVAPYKYKCQIVQGTDEGTEVGMHRLRVTLIKKE